MTNITAAVYAIYSARRVVVGSSRDVRPTLAYYRGLLRRGKHYNLRLQRDWTRDGASSFRFVILDRCGAARLTERTRYWHKKLHATNAGTQYLGAAHHKKST